MKKIAFLFLTKQDLVHNNLWQTFFANHQSKYTIYSHSSTSGELSGVLKRTRIKTYVKTSWGKTALAHQALLSAALTNKDNYKFITCSESCVPLQNFDKVYSWLTKDNSSFIKLDPIVGENIRVVKERIDGTNLVFIDVKKHAANYALNRKHARIIADGDVKVYDFMANGDEHFLSALWKTDDRNIKDIWAVFSDWKYTAELCQKYTQEAENMYKKYKQIQENKGTKGTKVAKYKKKIGEAWAKVHTAAKHPRVFKHLKKESFDGIKNHYFARKFAAESNIGEWVDYGELLAGKVTLMKPRGGFPAF